MYHHRVALCVDGESMSPGRQGETVMTGRYSDTCLGSAATPFIPLCCRKMPRLRVSHYIVAARLGRGSRFPVGAVYAYRRQRWHVDFQVSLYKYNDEVFARLTRTCCNVCVRLIFYRKIKSLNRFTSLSCLLDVKCSCVSVLQYYEMSYGLNVEMHKQVRVLRSSTLIALCNVSYIVRASWMNEFLTHYLRSGIIRAAWSRRFWTYFIHHEW